MKIHSTTYSAIIALASGFIFLIISLPVFGFISLPVNYHPEGSGTSNPVGVRECETPFTSKPQVSQSSTKENGDLLVVTNTPVFLVKPGTTGKLCIRYTELSSGQTFSGKVYSQVVNSAGGKNVTITPRPENITAKDYYFANAIDALQNKHSFDVVYDVSAAPDSRGFYGLWPLGVCPGLPLAVGYDATQINYSQDFAWMIGTYYGCSGFIDEKMVGLSSIEVSYVTNKTKSNIGYEMTGIDYDIKKDEGRENPQTAGSNLSSQKVTIGFTVHFHTYDAAFNVIADARDFAIAHFVGNPQFEKEHIGCSWAPTNDTALELPGNRSIYGDNFAANTKYVKIDGRSEKILPHTADSAYRFIVTLTNLPDGYYALQPAIFISDENEQLTKYGVNANTAATKNVSGQAIASFFPITVGDGFQSPFVKEKEAFSINVESIHGKC